MALFACATVLHFQMAHVTLKGWINVVRAASATTIFPTGVMASTTVQGMTLMSATAVRVCLVTNVDVKHYS